MDKMMLWTLRGEELNDYEPFMAEGDSTEGTPMYNVPITLMNVFMFRNARKKLTNIEDMQASLKQHGLIQPLAACRVRHKVQHHLTFLAMFSGFRRLEAYRRNAIGHLVERYNTDKGLKPKQAGYLTFDDGEWFLKVLEVYGEEVHTLLAGIAVNCNVSYVADTLQAYYKNGVSDMQRVDVPIGDVIDRISEFYDMGQKRDQIAEGLSIKPESVSNYSKVGNLPYYMERYVCTGDVYETLTDEQKADRLAMAEMLRVDMLRRLHLPKTEDASLKFTTLRKLGSVAMYGNDRDLCSKSFSDKYLHQEVVLESLKFLCCWDGNSGKVKVDQATPDLGTFNNFMSHMETRSASMRSDGSPVIVDTPTAEGAASEFLPTPVVDAGSLELTTEIVSDSKFSEQKPTPVVSADIAARQAEARVSVLDDAEAVDEQVEADEQEEEYQETTEDQFDNLVGEGGNEEAGEKIDGASKRVTTSKPEAGLRIQAVPPTVLMKRAQDFSKFADATDDVHPFDRLAFYQTAGELWNLLGFKAKHELYAARFDEYLKAVLEYYGSMEEKALEAGFDMPLPALPDVPEELAHLKASAAGEQAAFDAADNEVEEEEIPDADEFEEEEEEEEDDFDEDADFEDEREEEEPEDWQDEDAKDKAKAKS